MTNLCSLVSQQWCYLQRNVFTMYPRIVLFSVLQLLPAQFSPLKSTEMNFEEHFHINAATPSHNHFVSLCLRTSWSSWWREPLRCTRQEFSIGTSKQKMSWLRLTPMALECGLSTSDVDALLERSLSADTLVRHPALHIYVDLWCDDFHLITALLLLLCIVGTLAFAPPEFHITGRYEAGPTTVWQLGALLYELLNIHKEFDTSEFLRTKVKFLSELNLLNVSEGKTMLVSILYLSFSLHIRWEVCKAFSFLQQYISAAATTIVAFCSAVSYPRLPGVLEDVFGGEPRAAGVLRENAAASLAEMKLHNTREQHIPPYLALTQALSLNTYSMYRKRQQRQIHPVWQLPSTPSAVWAPPFRFPLQTSTNQNQQMQTLLCSYGYLFTQLKQEKVATDTVFFCSFESIDFMILLKPEFFVTRVQGELFLDVTSWRSCCYGRPTCYQNTAAQTPSTCHYSSPCLSPRAFPLLFPTGPGRWPPT